MRKNLLEIMIVVTVGLVTWFVVSSIKMVM